MKKLLAMLIFSIFTLPTVKAADIYASDNFIILSGPIIEGDYDSIIYKARYIPYGKGIVVLNSQGGVASEGMNIAKYIHQQGFATVVYAGDHCYSACAIIWASGIERFATLPQSKIGFHAVYDPKNLHDKGDANAVLGALLSQFGYSFDAIAFMTRVGAGDLSYLNEQSAKIYGINYHELNSYNDISSKRTSYNLSAYDVVLGFYQALSNADGDLAAAYVIPEKRGIGPFNQTNIYRFYSSLRVPLQVHNIYQINQKQFRVDYTFTAVRTQCKGTAIVTTENYSGYNLIRTIKANC
ncbi:hypothetical protein A4G19_02435 [Pasteurellaceae bacterium Macca]|nr:hypothetical protein [Pasteurellaceae bacterium Macca]